MHFDLKILTHLLRDGRAPAQQVADSIGLSRPAVADRIARLERDGVIRDIQSSSSRRPSAAPSPLSSPHVVKASSMQNRRRLFDVILKSDEIVEAHTVAGDDCFSSSPYGFHPVPQHACLKVDAPPLSLSTRTTIVMLTHCEKSRRHHAGGAMKQSRALAYAAFAVVCIVWGTTYLAIRIAVTDHPAVPAHRRPLSLRRSGAFHCSRKSMAMPFRVTGACWSKSPSAAF